jgi:hypothetical protein
MPELAISWAVLRVIPAPDELVAEPDEPPPGELAVPDDEPEQAASRPASATAPARAAAALGSVFLCVLVRMRNVITEPSMWWCLAGVDAGALPLPPEKEA